MIRVEHASVRFGGIRAVDDVSFDIPDGRITGLIGPNGAGKTTMFNAIAGHLKLDSGSIRLRDRDITALPPHERARLGLARTFQIPHEFTRLTVVENLMAAAPMPLGESVFNVVFRRSTYGAEEKAAYHKAREIISFLEIDHVAGEKAGRKLSKAQGLGTDIWDEAKLMEILENVD